MKFNLKRLKAERVAQDISQQEMAEAMGWKHRSVYAKRENGIVDIGVDEFARMAEVLGYSDSNISIFFRQTVPEKGQDKEIV